ncbi:MAG TPA: GNAT family N-acetyltransferase [Pyrinomonadaceae bacterium]|nr:GNAT family N-acetyltransferase [Pyrinomonadaceae bacterium]
MSEPISLQIRFATEADITLIFHFIQALASYEDLLDHFEATEQRLANYLFGKRPKAHVLLAEHGGESAGFAVYYFTFTTFAGLPGIYLEDLFVKPEKRRAGIGRALLKHLAQLAKQEGCCRIEWAVLHWNESAISFYEKLGAQRVDDWSTYRLFGEALRSLGQD